MREVSEKNGRTRLTSRLDWTSSCQIDSSVLTDIKETTLRYYVTLTQRIHWRTSCRMVRLE